MEENIKARRDKAAKHAREYRANNKEKLQAYDRNRYAELPVEKKIDRSAKSTVRARRYRAERGEEISAQQKAWLQANPGKSSEYTRRWEAKNPEKAQQIAESRDYLARRANKYGLTVEQYMEMLRTQKRVCAICFSPEFSKKGSLSIDHDHETGKVRGLLCDRCNTGLGRFLDEPDLLESAAAYLRRHRGV